ncbi:hypothetical protein CAPTEDRAFT_217221 [Capitella teleta]|uniref:Chitin-binding type-2 domain-containing protein n=1 Tax=Capitella teleta TaxID=283909 RepID=R7U3U8_CAPTE|nr:hypothetical protein CAPTEDRAFT_217221 [Capitella teleta]|eukprot:ELT97825.1 hypothetical protein CAPTEDRAFT_217221 [Capitella teleta]
MTTLLLILLVCFLDGSCAKPTPDKEANSLSNTKQEKCYSCSSKSALCQTEVYDGKYLSITTCNSSCFLKREANVTYRGCFDGWLGGVVDGDYIGCRIQQYLGERVEWCFCRHGNQVGSSDEPCNSVSVADMRRMSELHTVSPTLSISGKYGISNDVDDDNDISQLPAIDKFDNMPMESAMSEFAKERLYDLPGHIEPVVVNDVVLRQFVHPLLKSPPQNPCKGRPDGTYPVEGDCQHYTQCFSGLAYRMTCPRGTSWNSADKRCVHPGLDGDCDPRKGFGRNGYYIDDWEGVKKLGMLASVGMKVVTSPSADRQLRRHQNKGNKNKRAMREGRKKEKEGGRRGRKKKIIFILSVGCYSCHDESPFCKERVSNSKRVDVSPCQSKCFIRQDLNKVYRGCFDGWLTTRIQHNYTGCQVQYYFGVQVTWCFCDKGLCNGGSMADVAEGRIHAVQESTPSSPPTYRAFSFAKEITPKRRPVFRPGMKAELRKSVNCMSISARVQSGWSHGACWGEQDGLYSDPVDCSRYIHCFNGYTYRRMCPFGTAWNPETARCDFPYNVPFICDVIDAFDYDTARDVEPISRDVYETSKEVPQAVIRYAGREGREAERPDPDPTSLQRPIDDFVYGSPTEEDDLDVFGYYNNEESHELEQNKQSLVKQFQAQPRESDLDEVVYKISNSGIVSVEDANLKSGKKREFREKFSKMGRQPPARSVGVKVNERHDKYRGSSLDSNQPMSGELTKTSQ